MSEDVSLAVLDMIVGNGEDAATFTIASAADLYLLKFILHDQDDAPAVKILASIRRAMNTGGRVVLVEMKYLGAIGEPGLGPLVDVNIMAVTGAREQARGKVCRRADGEAGAKAGGVTPTGSLIC